MHILYNTSHLDIFKVESVCNPIFGGFNATTLYTYWHVQFKGKLFCSKLHFMRVAWKHKTSAAEEISQY